MDAYISGIDLGRENDNVYAIKFPHKEQQHDRAINVILLVMDSLVMSSLFVKTDGNRIQSSIW